MLTIQKTLYGEFFLIPIKMNPLRSEKTTKGPKMAGARSLWRANGMQDAHFGKPVIAVVNSFTQFVPGHVHLHTIGQQVKQWIQEQGCFAAEFNTIAIDDGIAMGHQGMLYSLPSRDLIADSVEYMVNAHCADAMICISNCDKITPGMLMAAMRLNIPTVFVSGGPMEAGNLNGKAIDLVDAIVKGAEENVSESELLAYEKEACPTCGCCSGMFTANSMNCLTEALGLAPAGNGTLLASHEERTNLFRQAAQLIVANTRAYYFEGNATVLPRSIATREAFLNAMALDIAMGGSTNTVLHLLAIAAEAEVIFSMKDIDTLSRKTPVLCKVAPNSHYHIEDVNRAGGVLGIMRELARAGMIDTSLPRVDFPNLAAAIACNNLQSGDPVHTKKYLSATGRQKNNTLASQHNYYPYFDTDRSGGCLRNREHAYCEEGGLAVLYGNLAADGCIVKTAGVAEGMLRFNGRAVVFDSQEAAVAGILGGGVVAGDVVVIRYEGPKGGPGMQEMLYPTSYLKSKGLDRVCALITDGRFSGGSSGLSIGHISPEAAAKGTIALVENGDTIEIDIPARRITLNVPQQTLDARADKMEAKGKSAFTAAGRVREVSKALAMYSKHVSSADKGAIRQID